MIEASSLFEVRLELVRLAQVASALALTGAGYGVPWALSAMHEAPETPRVVQAQPVRPVVRIALAVPPPPEDPATPEPVDTLESITPAVAAAEPARVLAIPSSTAEVQVPVESVPEPTPVEPEAAPAPVERTARKKRRRKKKRPCDPDRPEIAKVSAAGYRVDASLADFYAHHPRESKKLARTWWNRDEEGDRDGFKVGRIRCGSLLHQLGLHSGDAVLTINGMRIQSYADGLLAYLRVRNRQLLWVNVERRGDPLRLDYLLVEDGTAERAALPAGLDPTALVDEELALEELPWRKRRKAARRHRSKLREAEAVREDLDLPTLSELREDLRED